MMAMKRWWFTLGLVLTLGPWTTGAANDAQEAFRAGVAASRENAYQDAIAYFETARSQGMDTGALHYNLGVAYYRTGQRSKATAAFQRAAATDTMAAPALYQLGRLAREDGDKQRARSLFQRAADQAETAELRSRARAALDDAAGAERAATAAPPDYIYVGLGASYDSNLTLSPSDSSATTEESGVAGNGSVIARVPWRGANYLRGSLYTQRFLDNTDFNILSLRGGVGRVGQLGANWRWDAYVDGNHQRFGGETFENALVTGVDGLRHLNDDWRFEMGYRLEASRGGSDFGFLDGTSHRVDASLNERQRGGWQVSARFERANRDDLNRGDDFFSFSRNEVALGGQYGLPLGENNLLSLEGEWTHRRYDDEEVRNGNQRTKREEDRYGFGIALNRSLGSDWSVEVSARAEQRSSNLNEFDYSRERLGVRLDRSF